MERELIERIAGARAVELSHPMTVGMPNHDSHPPYLFTPYLRYGDFALGDGYSGTNELIVMSGHSGTHLDSFAHVACHGRLYGGHDMTVEQVGGGIAGRGIRHHGIDAVAPIVRRGVLLDVAAHRGVDVLPPAHPIDAAELQAAAAAAGVEVGAGDCVLVRTGQGRHWDDQERYMGEAEGVAGITPDAGEWLVERGVFLVGSDTSVVERTAPELDTLAVHMLLLARHGVHLLENMALEQLHAEGAAQFLFLCLPLLLRGASGSPVRAVALL